MNLDVKVPDIDTTKVLEIKIALWNVKDGDFVKKNASLCFFSTIKATIELIADKAGYVKILKKADSLVVIGETICVISDILES